MLSSKQLPHDELLDVGAVFSRLDATGAPPAMDFEESIGALASVVQRAGRGFKGEPLGGVGGKRAR